MKSYLKVFMIGLKNIKKYVWDDEHIFEIFWLFILPLSVSYFLIECKNLNDYEAFAVGVIERTRGAKNTDYQDYTFFVGDSVYSGYDQASNKYIRPGDSVVIRYDYTNPDNNEIYCHYIYTLDRSKLPDTVYHRQMINLKRQPIYGEFPPINNEQ